MEKGQTVYLRPVELGNAYRIDKSIKKDVVEKVGRKYVTLARYGKFDIKSGMEKTLLSSDYELFEDKEKLNLKIESEDLQQRIKNSIPKYGGWKIDIEKLRKITDILNC